MPTIYDVLAGGEVVGRILKASVSVARPLMWTLGCGNGEDRTHGYAATRGAAMAAFAKAGSGTKRANLYWWSNRPRWARVISAWYEPPGRSRTSLGKLKAVLIKCCLVPLIEDERRLDFREECRMHSVVIAKV